MKNLFCCIFVFSLLSAGYCAGRKIVPNFTRIQVAFWGLDTTDTSMENGYPKDIYIQEIRDSSMFNIFSNYPKWKRSPNYKCSPNARINFFKDDSLVQSFEALFSQSCSYAIVLINSKGSIKTIPKELLEHMLKIRSGIPKKFGWIIL